MADPKRSAALCVRRLGVDRVLLLAPLTHPALFLPLALPAAAWRSRLVGHCVGLFDSQVGYRVLKSVQKLGHTSSQAMGIIG